MKSHQQRSAVYAMIVFTVVIAGCGGSSNDIADGRVIGTVDAAHDSTIDASRDAGTVDSLAAIDAAPPIDAPIIFDATPDATPDAAPIPVLTISVNPVNPSLDPHPRFSFAANVPVFGTDCNVTDTINGGGPGETECTSPWIVSQALPASTYNFTVTGYDNNGDMLQATYTWTIGTQSCGDGFIDTGEVCDDGAANGGADECSADCQTWIYANGDGSSENPFQISTANELVAMNNSAFSSSAFQLTADIDLGNTFVAPFGASPDFENFDFAGAFDGNHHSISNWLYMSFDSCVGLFARLHGLVHDVSLIAPNVTADNYVGALVGCNYDGQIVRDSVVGGAVYAETGVAGGLVGINGAFPSEDLSDPGSGNNNGIGVAVVANSSSGAAVTGQFAGGLVGATSATIQDSFATGNVTGLSYGGGPPNYSSYAGGLVGIASPTLFLEDDFDWLYLPQYTSPLSGPYTYAEVIRSYSTGAVSGGQVGNGGLFYCQNDPQCLNAADSYWDVTDSNQTTSVAGSTALTAEQMTSAANFGDWDFVNVWQANVGHAPSLKPTGFVAPVVQPTTITTTKPVPFAFSINAYDFQDDDLTFAIVTPPTRGTATHVSGNQFTYTPESFDGFTDSFLVTASDGQGHTSTPTQVMIYVTPTCNPAEPGFSHGGTGTQSDPYILSTVAELQLAHGYLTCRYLMQNDIDLDGVDFAPLGNTSYPFTATFDGGGHSIRNWSYTNATDTSVGFFGSTSQGTTIKNLTLANVDVAGTSSTISQSVGGLVGGLVEYLTVQNVNVSGSVTSNSWFAGGLFGWAEYLTMTNCSNSATVSGIQAGGLIGRDNYGSTITHSNNSGAVIATQGSAGGIFGQGESETIRTSFSTGPIQGTSIVGGLAGVFYFAVVSDSYSTSAVTVTGGGGIAGGLVGQIYFTGTANNIFATGAVGGGNSTGGLFGDEEDASAFTTDAFWDVDTTGQATTFDNDGVGESDLDMQSQSTYVGFDFVSTWNPPLSGGYPTLR